LEDLMRPLPARMARTLTLVPCLFAVSARLAHADLSTVPSTHDFGHVASTEGVTITVANASPDSTLWVYIGKPAAPFGVSRRSLTVPPAVFGEQTGQFNLTFTSPGTGIYSTMLDVQYGYSMDGVDPCWNVVTPAGPIKQCPNSLALGPYRAHGSLARLGLRSGDVDYSGSDDLVELVLDGEKLAWRVHLATSSGFVSLPYASSSVTYEETAGASRVLAGDLNGDERTDLLHVRTAGGRLIAVPFLATGNGAFERRPTLSTGNAPFESDRFYKVLLADLNADGFADFVHARTDSGDLIVRVHLSNGDGTFRSLPWFRSGIIAQEDDAPADLLAANLNGDGRDDLILERTDGAGTRLIIVPFLTGDDAAFFTRMPTVPSGKPREDGKFFKVLAADVNGDGRTDVVHLRSAGGGAELVFRWHLSNGDGTFTSQPWLHTGLIPGDDAGPTDALAGRLDDDLDDDILFVRTSGAGTRLIAVPFLIDAATTSAVRAPTLLTDDVPREDGQFFKTLLTDVNGDGRPDFIHSRTSSNGTRFMIRAHLSTGAGTFDSLAWYRPD
jgi:VCBS repeat protein